MNYASAVRYLFSVVADSTGDVTASPDEMTAIDAFNEKIESAGHRVLAAGLESLEQAKIFDNRNGRDQIADRPAVASDVFMAGFWVIEADDDSIAHRLAAEASRACNRQIEVRKFLR